MQSDRRTFLRTTALVGGAVLTGVGAATRPTQSAAQPSPQPIPVKPTSVSLEKWMRIPVAGSGLEMFTFSGFAQFVWGQNHIIGGGGNDTAEQKNYVEYHVKELFVGPHWQAVRGCCPMVVASGHDQLAPDEADGMGYEVTAIKKVNLVQRGPDSDPWKRIELQILCKV